MGCTHNPEINNQLKQNTPKYVRPSTNQLVPNNINQNVQNVQNIIKKK